LREDGVVRARSESERRPALETTRVGARRYCGWLGVPLWTRTVSELSRKTSDRAAYEETTREARFWTYAAAAGENGVVLLGHNRDDCFENIFTNLNKGRSYDELRGMRDEGVERGVSTWRPLLATDKTAIYAAADVLGLPHLADSTNPECDRGRLRDAWLPLVRAEQPLLLQGLENLADHLAFLQRRWADDCDAYVRDRVVRTDAFCDLPVEPWMLDAPASFWVDVFHRLSDAPRPSNRALANMAAWLPRQVAAARPSTCELNNFFRAAYFPDRDVLRVYLVGGGGVDD